MKIIVSAFLTLSVMTSYASTEPAPLLVEGCVDQLSKIPGEFDKESLQVICEKAQALPECVSTKGAKIYHFEKEGTGKDDRKKILTLALIHGDEAPSGTVARSWLQRLGKIDPRNTWRVIAIANPDGLEAKTRTNANGVDINRNFPSSDWDEKAINTWKTKIKDPRKYPGPSSASEKETNCLLKHFSEFKPDFVISIHTPLGVLDFDGPKVQAPKFSPLPWTSLGQYPGSLGKYMWIDSKTPVLTIELKGSTEVRKLEKFDQLQDISGTIAIQADKIMRTETGSSNKKKAPTKPSSEAEEIVRYEHDKKEKKTLE